MIDPRSNPDALDQIKSPIEPTGDEERVVLVTRSGKRVTETDIKAWADQAESERNADIADALAKRGTSEDKGDTDTIGRTFVTHAKDKVHAGAGLFVEPEEDVLAELFAKMGDVKVLFWQCWEHHPKEPRRVTVLWEGSKATCQDCGRTNQDPDDPQQILRTMAKRFGPEEITKWLHGPKEDLGGKSPIDVLSEKGGKDRFREYAEMAIHLDKAINGD